MSRTRDERWTEYRRSETERDDYYDRRSAVREWLNRSAAALAGSRSDTETAARIVEEQLVPLLIGDDGVWRYDELLRGRDGYRWDFRAVRRAVRGELDDRHVQAAVDSLGAIAKREGIVDDVSNHSTGEGFSGIQTARVWSKMDMELGDPVRLVTRDSGWPKSMYIGGTGQGKSTALETSVEDRYHDGMKIVDLVDTDEFENGVYDLPQSQPELRDVRREAGVSPDATKTDRDTPEVEILVPKHTDTQTLDVPVRPDGTTVVKPFTIPAAQLDQTTVVSFLAAMLSRQQETAVRTAYDEVRDRDWSLSDLADQIRRREDLEPKFQRRVLRLLDGLSSKGFITDSSADDAIDWERIFRDTDTITAFSVAPLFEETDQFVVLSYLCWAVYSARKNLDELPPCAAVLRELHEIVPHRNESASDDRVNALQAALASNLSYTLRKNRHERLEVLADTQDLLDVKKGVRKRFSRFVAFNLPDDSLKKTFEYTGGSSESYQSARTSIPREAGYAGVIGATEPGVVRGLDFVSPVQWIPPSFHHFDVDQHDDGLTARVGLTDETIETVRWDATPVEEIDASLPDDSPENAYQRFADECLVADADNRVQRARVIRLYNSWAEQDPEAEQVARNWFARRFRNNVEGYPLYDEKGDTNTYYGGIALSPNAAKYETSTDGAEGTGVAD